MTLKASEVGGRIKAAETCRERGWTTGTLLESQCWQERRKVSTVDLVGAVLRRVLPDGRLGTREFIKTLPADVRAVDGG